VDALVQPVVYKLETYINNIEASKRRILELRDAAHIAQQADMKFALENTSAGASLPGPLTSIFLLIPRADIAIFRDQIQSALVRMASNNSAMSGKIDAIERTVQGTSLTFLHV
jgi:hypothetical protein